MTLIHESLLRKRCRKCKSKLPEPTHNEHRAFCTPGCWRQFHYRRCIVCEKPIHQGSRGRRWLCRKPACRSELARWPDKYKAFDFEPQKPKIAADTGIDAINSTSPTAAIDFEATKSDRATPKQTWRERWDEAGWTKGWRQIAGPPLSPDSFRAAVLMDDPLRASFDRTERQNRDIIRRATANPDAIFQRDTPPLNLCGGYKFPGAPKLGPKQLNRAAYDDGRVDALLADIDDETGIPAFLRRPALSATHKQETI